MRCRGVVVAFEGRNPTFLTFARNWAVTSVLRGTPQVQLDNLARRRLA